MHRAVVINGLVRKPEILTAYLDELEAIECSIRPRIIFASWRGELGRYPTLLTRLKSLAADIIERDPPNLVLRGHAFHQMVSLDAALSLLDDSCFVLKLRPDMMYEGGIRRFIQMAESPVIPSAIPGLRFRNKLGLMHVMAAEPFLWGDPIFSGPAGGLRLMTQAPMLAGVNRQNLAAEQWLWSAPFTGVYPALEAFFRVYPGMIFHDAELIEGVRSIYLESRLYAAALAAHLHAFVHYCSFIEIHPVVDCRSAARNHTVEELLWSPVKLDGMGYGDAVRSNGIGSPYLIDALWRGDFAPSAFGELLSAEVRNLILGDLGLRSFWEAQAASLGERLMSLGIAGGKSIVRRDGIAAIGAGEPLWALAT